MFRSNSTILREIMLSLAKATILWNLSVKLRRYTICGVAATSISDCDVCVLCSVHTESDQNYLFFLYNF